MAEQHGTVADVCVLGPLRLCIADTWTGIEARRQRMVFGVLLAHAGRVVAADRLLDEAWGGDPPRAGLQALRYHLSKLRDLLAPGRDRGDGGPIHTVGSGYRLLVEPAQTDAGRFEHLATRGTQLAADGQWARAAHACDEALGLWRGRAWEDFRYAAFAQPEIRRLEERRVACLEDRIDAQLAAGASQELVAELRELTTRHPLRERFWAQTMVALYRAGRGAEAARAYELARRRLRDELGVEPSPSLQRLHREVLDQSVPVQGPRPGAPRPPAGAPPVGAGNRETATRPASGSPRVAQHPASSPLVERRNALARLNAVHDGLDTLRGRVVVVRGEAGIGKTAVVRRFLHEIAGRADTLVGVATTSERRSRSPRCGTSRGTSRTWRGHWQTMTGVRSWIRCWTCWPARATARCSSSRTSSGRTTRPSTS